MDKKRNYSIDIFRYIAALLVIICHADLLVEADPNIYQFVARFMPRISVSFFFAVSGYYYLKALLKDKADFKKQFMLLLKIYGFWTIIYYGASFVDNIILGNRDIKTFLVERVVFFLTKGSYAHFWYFPALIYSVVIVTIIYKLFGKKGIQILSYCSIVLFVFGNLGSSYYEVGMNIPVVRYMVSGNRTIFEVFRGIFCMGMPYFLLGYFLNQYEDKIQQVSRKTEFITVVITGVLYVAEIIIVANILKWNKYPEVFLMLYPATFIVFSVLLRHPKESWKSKADLARRLSAYLYYVHPLIILVLGLLSKRIGIIIPSIVTYCIVVGSATLSGWIFIKWKWKWLL